MPDGLPTTNEWLNYADNAVNNIGGAKYHSALDYSEVMELKTPYEIEGTTRECLEYYSSWMASLNERLLYWRMCYDWLERRYKNLISSYVANSKSVSKASYEAKANYWALDEAVFYAKSQYEKFKVSFSTAETYRDLVSRSLTSLESERKITR